MDERAPPPGYEQELRYDRWRLWQGAGYATAGALLQALLVGFQSDPRGAIPCAGPFIVHENMYPLGGIFAASACVYQAAGVAHLTWALASPRAVWVRVGPVRSAASRGWGVHAAGSF